MFNKIFKPLIILFFIFYANLSTFSIAENYPNTSIGVLDLNMILLDAKAAKNAAN